MIFDILTAITTILALLIALQANRTAITAVQVEHRPWLRVTAIRVGQPPPDEHWINFSFDVRNYGQSPAIIDHFRIFLSSEFDVQHIILPNPYKYPVMPGELVSINAGLLPPTVESSHESHDSRRPGRSLSPSALFNELRIGKSSAYLTIGFSDVLQNRYELSSDWRKNTSSDDFQSADYVLKKMKKG